VDFERSEAAQFLPIKTSLALAKQNPVWGTMDHIGGIGQGSGQSQRDGRQCVITDVHIKGDLSLGAQKEGVTPRNAEHVRILLVLDTQTNGAQCTLDKVLQTPAGGGANFCETNLYFRNLEHVRRFKILEDKHVAFTALNQTCDSGDANIEYDHGSIRYSFTINKKLRLPVTYTAATDALSGVADNSLHVFAIASSTDVCNISYNGRVRFYG